MKIMDSSHGRLLAARCMVVGGLVLVCLASFLPHFQSDKIWVPYQFLFGAFGALFGQAAWYERLLVFAMWPPYLLLVLAPALYASGTLAKYWPESRAAFVLVRIIAAAGVVAMFAAAWYGAQTELGWIDRYDTSFLRHPALWRAVVWAVLPAGLVAALAAAAAKRRTISMAIGLCGTGSWLSVMLTWFLGCRMDVQFGFYVSWAGCFLVACGSFLWMAHLRRDS